MKNKKVNWAVVGVGDIVRKRAGAAILQQPDSLLYACVEIEPELRKVEIESLAPEAVFTNMEPMLSDPKVDAVYISTPVHLHAPQTIAALEAGKDVLVEKPMALNSTEAAEMCRVADKNGRRLAVAYFRRFSPRFQLVKDMLDQGEFGQVVLVRIAVHSWYAGRTDNWRQQPELAGGGVLSDVGVHKFDLLSWWFGLPTRIAARCETLVHDYQVEDSASILMVLGNGAHCVCSFHWNSKTWTDEIHVVGTDAKITLHPSDGDEAIITVGRDVERRKISNPENLHYPLIDDFAHAIVEDRYPRFSGLHGMDSTQIMEVVLRSSERKQWLTI